MKVTNNTIKCMTLIFYNYHINTVEIEGKANNQAAYMEN